ncbi:hypothetical protein [Paraburkholderia lacunae]|nr:hypothetical protein [Paraburkholderia lacunae]
MTQSNPQQAQAVAAQSAQSARPTASSFAASMLGMRTVAMSLLVDRALSA